MPPHPISTGGGVLDHRGWRWTIVGSVRFDARTAARQQLLLRAMRDDVSASVLRSDIYASLSGVYILSFRKYS